MSSKTLVFAFDIERLDEVQFHDFMKRIMDAQVDMPLGLCKFNLFQQGTIQVMHELDKVYFPDMAAADQRDPAAGVRCICPMCEHHRSAEKIER